MTSSGAQDHIPYGRLVRICGALAAGVGCIALLGWGLGLPFLAGLGSGRIPMAPSTALLFVLYGVATVFRARFPLHRGGYWLGVVVHGAGALVAVLLFLLSYQGVYLDAEHLGFTTIGVVGGVPIGHMSPVTALGFLLASLSFLASLPPYSNRRWRVVMAWCCACLLLAASSVLLLAYLYGTPLLYGGSFIPPAATTSLAFAALGAALSAIAGRQAWPRGEPDDAATRPAPVLFLVFILLAAGIITAGYVYFRSYAAQYRAEVERELSSVAELKVSELAHYRTECLDDSSIFLRNPFFSALVQRFFNNPADGEAHARLRAWLSNYGAHHHHDRVSLLDPQAAVRMSVPEGAVPIASEVARRAINVLRSGEVVFQDFYRDEHDQRIYLTLLVPILDEAHGGRALGVLALRIDPETYLYPFISRWPTSSETAETVLIRRDGNDALYLNEVRFKKDTALTLRIPLARQDTPAVKAALGQEGIVEGVDYRGVSVIADVRAVPDSPWFLVTRIAASEVDAPLRERMWMTVLLIGALLAGAGAGIGGVWRQQQAGFYRERYQAATALRESEARFRVLIEGVTDHAIFMLDPDGRVVSWNAGAERLKRYRADEIIGQHFSCFYPEEDVARGKPAMELETAAAAGRFEDEGWRVRKDGSRFWANVVITALHDESGHLRGFSKITRDITERKQAEAALEATHAKIRRDNALIEAINDALARFITAENPREIFDSLLDKLLSLTASEYGFIDELLYTTDGQPYLIARAMTNIAWNDETRTLYPKFLTGELCFTNLKSLFGAVMTSGAPVIANDAPNDSRRGGVPPGHPALNAFLGLPLRSGQELVGVIGLANASGGYSEQSVTFLEPMVNGCANFIAALRNDQRRRQLEEQLRQSQKMEAVGQLAGGIAHDFNNQIFVINGYCDLLLADAAGQPAFLGPLAEIKKAAHRSAELTAQLLAFSRKQMLQPKVLDLNAELIDTETMLRRLIGEDIQLTLMMGQDVGHVKVDPNQLQQVVMNLAVNARDAMPHGGQLTIETNNVGLDEGYARSHLEVRPGPYVLLSMSDTGHGMDRETLTHVFEPFFTTKGPGKGTGLGLATALGIVKQSGGHIAIYSERDHGTTFKIYLPRVDEPVETTERRVPNELVDGSETILVVEDEAAVRELVRRVLAEHGYHVLPAASGKEALLLAEASGGPIHLLLTDVVMPEMSGSQLAERLTAVHPETRVIYMSGYTENAIVHHGVLKAGLAFLPKPCPTDLLVRKVREILDARPRKDLRGSRILVVDDSENDRILQAHMLSNAGCVMLEAGGGAEALEVLEREAVDAVVTDVNMPGMDGFALTEVIRRTPQLRTLPVIILSGTCTQDEQARSRAVGATAYLSKATTDQQGLLDTLGKVL